MFYVWHRSGTDIYDHECDLEEFGTTEEAEARVKELKQRDTYGESQITVIAGSVVSIVPV